MTFVMISGEHRTIFSSNAIFLSFRLGSKSLHVRYSIARSTGKYHLGGRARATEQTLAAIRWNDVVVLKPAVEGRKNVAARIERASVFRMGHNRYKNV